MKKVFLDTNVVIDFLGERKDFFMDAAKIICQADKEVVQKALNSEYKDLEDAMQYYSAITAEADVIVTRNVKDFINHNIPVITPTEYLATQANKTN